MFDLIIDSEFKDLIPPLSDEEFKQLEKNLLRDGIQDPLKVWNNTLIDGHNRYLIANRHGLHFTTVDMQFASRDDVKIWIVKNQFGRRDLTTYERSVIALKLKPVIAAKAKENQGTRTDLNFPQTFAECKEKTSAKEQKQIENDRETNAQIAEQAGVSRETIRKVEKIEQKATPEIKAALKAGEISINEGYKAIKRADKIKSQQEQAERKAYTPPLVPLHYKKPNKFNARSKFSNRLKIWRNKSSNNQKGFSM